MGENKESFLDALDSQLITTSKGVRVSFLLSLAIVVTFLAFTRLINPQ
jgi:hypothetical protein